MHTSSDALQKAYTGMVSLSVYRNVIKQPVTGALFRVLTAIQNENTTAMLTAYGELCSNLAQVNCLHSLPAAIAHEVLTDDNIFCLTAAEGKQPTTLLLQAAFRDLAALYEAACLPCELFAGDYADILPRFDHEPAPAPLDTPWGDAEAALLLYHAQHGCGQFAMHNAFLWRDGKLHPVLHPDPIRLHHLKGYAYQRGIAVENTKAFLSGYEGNNMLLYGDRGTGKSSTVKALLNEYSVAGLRMIEIPKEYLRQLPDLTGYLSKIPMKFIVFIDDLSFSSDDDNFAALKAVLEGGLESRPDNVLIYATSNRRHLLRESFSNRSGDEVHHADTIQESVSLSDRFGISLTFLMPDQQRFRDIITQMAQDLGVDAEPAVLLSAAECWANERGGRSPRYARQFIAYAKAKIANGEPLI